MEINNSESQTEQNISDNTEPYVAVIIVNWNKRDDILNCLQSLQRLTYTNFKVWVVDNASTDGSVKAIEKRYHNVHVIRNRENRGGSGGFNSGIRAAKSMKPDYYYLLDNDVILDSEALKYLVEALEKNTKVGIVGSKIYFMNQPNVIWCMGGKIDWWQGNTKHISAGQKENGIMFNTPIEVDYVPACSLLVKREVIDKVGTMDERFFVYGDDADFCTRTKRAGYEIICIPSSKVWHKASNTVGNVSPFILYYYFRNNLLFMLKHASRVKRIVFYSFFFYKFFRIILILLAKCLFKGQQFPSTKIKALIVGVLDYKSGKYGKRF